MRPREVDIMELVVRYTDMYDDEKAFIESELGQDVRIKEEGDCTVVSIEGDILELFVALQVLDQFTYKELELHD